ncbi:MAG: SUMF1/EgtB/PvdO family nonheme iron enzyme [Rhodospirillales bacterium]
MADVFISYAREDRASAEKLAHALEAHGWSVWWDREILPGKDFSAVIGTEIAAAKTVVVLWSRSSVASNWVRDEAHEGLERSVLVPVLLDGSEPPMGYRAIQGVSLQDWEPGRDHLGFSQLIEAITALQKPGEPSPSVGLAAFAVSPQLRPWYQRKPFAMGAIFAGLALIAILLFILLGHKDEAPRPPIVSPLRSFKDCPHCPEMVALNTGAFRMGTSWFDREAQSDERPVVNVSIDKPFAIGRTEVTFAQWDACVADRGCHGYSPDDRGWGRGKFPVIYVSWEDAQTYVEWLKSKTGKDYRLPTEAEWEYACRAGTETKYPYGDQITPELANFNRAVSRPQPVGSYPPNGWGLSDMNGNLWEWVEDTWVSGHRGRPTDQSVRDDGDPQDRVIRGGSWDDRPRRVRCISRNRKDRDQRENEIGFRVALTSATP